MIKKAFARLVSVGAALIMTIAGTGADAFAYAYDDTADSGSSSGGIRILSVSENAFGERAVYIDAGGLEDFDEERLLYASPAGLTDEALINASAGMKWGYSSLASMSNSKARQAYYDILAENSMKAWHSTADLDNEDMGIYLLFTANYSALGLSRDEAMETYAIFKCDNPIYFFISRTVYYDDEVLYVITDDFYSKSEQREEYKDAVKDFLVSTSSAVYGETQLYSKAWILHDKIAGMMEYDHGDYSTDSIEFAHIHSIIGGIVNGRGVCESYAKLYTMAAGYNGLDCIYTFGSSINNAGHVDNHAWNLLRLDDGEFYNFDVTWDDTTDSEIVYYYFACGSANFDKSHFPGSLSSNPLDVMYSLPTVPEKDFDTSGIHFHRYGEWSVMTEPTCTQNGRKVRVCETCQRVDSEVLPAYGHRFGEWKETKKARCTTDGEESRTCPVCKTTETQTIPALGHDMKTKTVEPTCTAEGYTEHYCTRCTYNYKDGYTKANGHRFGSWNMKTKPSCTADGEEVRTCSVCNETESRILKTSGHSYNVSVVPATCTERGYTLHYCPLCNDSYRDNYTAALGHKFTVVNQTEQYTEKLCVRCKKRVKEYKTVTRGDLNNDNDINTLDFALLKQFILGWSNGINEAAADMNDDNDVNVVDLALLKNTILGWS